MRRTAPVFLRQLDQGFYGIGCPHPGIECLVAQITKLLVHYGCRSGVGIQMSVTTELLLTELGLSLQPLQESFSNFGRWVTDTWLKSVWEKVSKFNITVEIALLPINPPQEGSQWFMQAVVAAGVNDAKELIQINHFPCHQQVLFLSDILDAGRQAIDKHYLEQQNQTANWSTLIFLLEQPPQRDLTLRRQVLYSLAPPRRVDRRIGSFLTKGHNIWEWQYDEEAKRVYHLKGNAMDIYTPSAHGSHTAGTAGLVQE